MTKNRKDVYTIIKKEGKDNFWLKIGVAFVNEDDSLNILLNALPLNGELHVRDPKPQDQE